MSIRIRLKSDEVVIKRQILVDILKFFEEGEALDKELMRDESDHVEYLFEELTRSLSKKRCATCHKGLLSNETNECFDCVEDGMEKWNKESELGVGSLL
jgi:hypothetical protein